ncbi:MAG: hypothetical protein PHU25_10805 [Deltaproteobacteria bacterium]|nr:hypothetical protein [Deltaproteobacteria bacterium]
MICKVCGTVNIEGIQFCSACGSALSGDQAEPRRDAPKQSVPAKTVLFGVAPQIIKPVPVAPPAQPVHAAGPGMELAKTALGMQVVTAEPAQVQMAKPISTPPPPPAAPAAKPGLDKRTVLGMRAVTAEPAQVQMAKPISNPPPPAAPAAKPGLDKRTVLGMRAVTAEPARMQTATPISNPPPAAAPEQVKPAHKELDQAETRAATIAAASEPSRTTASSAEPDHRAERPAQSRSARDDVDEWPDEEKTPRGRSPGLLIAVVAAGVLIIGCVVVILYLFLGRGDNAVRAQIFPSPDGASITVVLAYPSAPPGAQVQIGGVAVPIAAGQARMDLPVNQLRLGENEILVTYAEPGKQPEAQKVEIALRHSSTTDLTGLVTAQPFFDVVFRVAPGIQLSVDGKPVDTSQGGYTQRVALASVMPVGEVAGDNLIYKLPFQLAEAGGATEQGQHLVTIPVTKLQIDRPAADAVVPFDTVTCSGVTEEGAEVTVNGRAAGVTAGGFSAAVPLPAMGDHVVAIVARAPGKAPRTSTIKVTRIASLDDAVAAWSKDLDRKLDYPTLARDAKVQVGKKLKVSGRVVNISTEKGVTAFLLYVGEGCPAGARCAVYVVFRGETDAGLQSSVDVYGTVRGTRDVDLRGGTKETMPAVEAKFVEKAKEPAKGKRR